MLRTLTTRWLAPALLLGMAHAAIAQEESPWQIEARAGAALPLGDLGDVELDTGISLSATLAWRFTDALSVYGGRGWHLLGADEVEATPDGTICLSVIVTPLFNAGRGSLLLPALFHFQVINPLWPDAQPCDTWLFLAVAVLIVWLNRDTMFTRSGASVEVIPGDAVPKA